MKVEVAVLGSPSLIVLMGSVDVTEEALNLNMQFPQLRRCVYVEVAVLGRPPNSPYGLCGSKETLNLNMQFPQLRSYVKVEVVVLGSPSLIVIMVSVAG